MAIKLPTAFDAQISSAMLATLGAAPGSTYLALANTLGATESANRMIAATLQSTPAGLADVVAGNLGLTGDAATAGKAYLTTVTFAGAQAGWGANLNTTLSLFSGLQSNATYGSAASAYVGKVNNALIYSLDSANNSTDMAVLREAAGSSGGGGGTVTPVTFALTTGEDAPVLTLGNDTITGALNTLSADDRISDASTTDNDVMNVTLNRTVAMDVTNIENININWDGFAAPTFDLDDVSGATVTFTSARTGYLGNVTFSNTGENNISAGAGITGTLTVGDIEDASVTATVAETIDINTADGAITVNAGAAETVSVTGAEAITLVALSADDILLETDFDTATVTLGVDADIELDGADDAVVNLNSDEDITVTIEVGSEFEVLNLGGEGAIDLDIEMVFGDFTEDTVISGGGDVTMSAAIATGDLSGIEHEVIRLATQNTATAVLTVLTGSNVVVEVNLGDTVDTDNVTFRSSEDFDTSSDSLTLTLETVQANSLIFDVADGEIENVKIIVAPNDDFDTDDDFIIHDLQGNNADDGPETAFDIDSADDDVNIVITTAAGAEIDASGVAGEFTVTQFGNETMTIFAAEGDTTANFTGTSTDSTFISGNDADDTVTFDTLAGTGVAQFAGGDNTVTTGGTLAVGGTIAVTAGDGDDTVTINTGALGTVSLLLGDGDNEVTLTAVGATGRVVMITGDGDDTVNLTTPVAGAVLNLNFGTGENTLALAHDTTIASTVIDTFTGLDIIQLEAGADEDATLDSAILHNQSYEILGEGVVGGALVDTLVVTLTATTAAFNAGNLDVSDGVSDGVLGLVISGGRAAGVTVTGSNGADNITGTAGDDTIIGGAGADTIDGNGGDDTITGGAGADSITLGTGNSRVVQGRTDSVVGVAGTAAGAAFAAADEITFANGVDTITGFNAGAGATADVLDLIAATLAVTAIGVDEDTLVAGTNYFLSGVFDEDVFTVAEDGAGADTLIIQGYAGAGTDITTNQSIVLLIGVGSDDLVAANFA